MQGDAYSDNRIKDSNCAALVQQLSHTSACGSNSRIRQQCNSRIRQHAQFEEQLLSKHAVSASPEMLSELSDAELSAHTARLHAGIARLEAELATIDVELARVEAFSTSKSEKQVSHAEGAAARATGARANEPSRHSAGAAELATFDVELAGVDAEERTRESARVRDRVSFSLLSKNELDAFEKRFPACCCPLCTSPLT